MECGCWSGVMWWVWCPRLYPPGTSPIVHWLLHGAAVTHGARLDGAACGLRVNLAELGRALMGSGGQVGLRIQ